MTFTVIRPIIPSDADDAVALLLRVFPHETEEAFRNVVESTHHDSATPPVSLVAMNCGQLVGFAQAIQVLQTPRVDLINWLAVDVDFRRQGIGRRLVNRLEKTIQTDHWHHESGTLMLISGTSPSYYTRIGYTESPIFDPTGQAVLAKIMKAM